MIKLTIRTSPQAAPRAILLDRDHVTLGRAASCDLQIPSPTISSHHLTFERRERLMFVADAGSTNGTQLNGKPLLPGEFVPLMDQATLQIIDVRLEVTYTQQAGQGFTLAESATLVREMVGDALREDERGDHPFFEVLSGPRQGQRLHLPLDVAEVWLTPDGELSREAVAAGARVSLGAGLPSAHAPGVGGLLCQGQPVDAPRSLHSRDRLQLGALQVIFFDPLQDFLTELDSPALRPPPGPVPSAAAPAAPPEPAPALASAPEVSRAEAAGAPPPDPSIEPSAARTSTPRVGWSVMRYGLLALVVVSVAASAVIFMALMGVMPL